jgi:ATP-dependent Clp protease ATP-binding subunit ClpB
MKKLPKQQGGVAYVSPRLLDLLARAERESSRDKAENVGVEHLLHALAQEIRGPAGDILSSLQGIGPGAFRPHLGVLEQAGEGGRVERLVGSDTASSSSRGTGYVRDLVAEAKAGRFDPVIGRDTRGSPAHPDPRAPLQEPPARRR